MSDLTKLTAEELRALSPEQLLRWLLVFQGGNWYDETRRRLEEYGAMAKSLQHVTKRLEKCEAALKHIYQLASRSLAEPLNESTPYVVDICTVIETLDMAIVDAARAAVEE